MPDIIPSQTSVENTSDAVLQLMLQTEQQIQNQNHALALPEEKPLPLNLPAPLPQKSPPPKRIQRQREHDISIPQVIQLYEPPPNTETEKWIIERYSYLNKLKNRLFQQGVGLCSAGFMYLFWLSVENILDMKEGIGVPIVGGSCGFAYLLGVIGLGKLIRWGTGKELQGFIDKVETLEELLDLLTFKEPQVTELTHLQLTRYLQQNPPLTSSQRLELRQIVEKGVQPLFPKKAEIAFHAAILSRLRD